MELVERPIASVEELRAALRGLKPGEVDAIAYVADAMVTGQAGLIIVPTPETVILILILPVQGLRDRNSPRARSSNNNPAAASRAASRMRQKTQRCRRGLARHFGR